LQIKRVLRAQLAIALILPSLAWPFGASIALSVLIGAGVCLVANLAFAYWVLRGGHTSDAKVLGPRLYGAEIAKLGLILALFAAAFATIEWLNPLALVAAYFAAQVLPALLASRSGAGQIPGS
jgi:ATP synthase protein I